ncbi:MAG: phosphate signaling complex protein PhoU [Elusimicrobiota bacterium]|jgi:phosphate transport system protein
MTTKKRFDDDLGAARARLLEMGAACEEMVHYAVKVLTERDPSRIDEVRRREELVNRLHVEVDERCLQLLALYQPAAGDLRTIAAALKISTDLERIGDQAMNIAETGLFFLEQPRMRLFDIPRMAELAAAMLKDGLDAFTRGDVEKARAVLQRDDEEDALKSRVFNELMQLMQADASTIQRGIDIILVARNLERIADHATNIAEDVIFMVAGKDIRHGAGVGNPDSGLPGGSK